MAELALLTSNESYLTLTDEVDWGVFPGSPTKHHVPVETYTVAMAPESRNATPFAGLRQRQHGRIFRGMPAGQLTTPLMGWRPSGMTPSLAQYLLTWGCANPEARKRASKSAEWYEGPNVANRRHRGLRVNSATVSAQEGGPVMIALDLMGQDEDDNTAVGSAPSLPNDREKLVEYDFTDCTLSIDGTAVEFGGFQWQVQHNIAPSYMNSKRPTALVSGDTIETLQLSPPKLTEAWDERIREAGLQEVPVVLTLKGYHNGTGTAETEWDIVTITFARCSLRTAVTSTERGIIMQPLEFDVLKPQSSSNGSVMAWTEA